MGDHGPGDAWPQRCGAGARRDVAEARGLGVPHLLAGVLGAVLAAEHAGFVFDAVTQDAAAAVAAVGGHRVDGAFEAVVGAGSLSLGDGEGFVVVIAAHVAGCHGDLPCPIGGPRFPPEVRAGMPPS
ncbi:hypothetical protein ARTHRO9V_200191 [Arthrobacter sp. 9V]|nr:hypothetical protein ARTHRO9V_200191 [Arthrobacter sp. 9V]